MGEETPLACGDYTCGGGQLGVVTTNKSQLPSWPIQTDVHEYNLCYKVDTTLVYLI
jgi:hypothetical protein